MNLLAEKCNGAVDHVPEHETVHSLVTVYLVSQRKSFTDGSLPCCTHR